MSKPTKAFLALEKEFMDFMGYDKTICDNCAHYHGKNTCDAFPEQIPFQILTGEANHKKPFPGDNGITFKKKKK